MTMNNKDTEAPERSYKDHLREQITNAEEATGYLSACYAEGPETFALAVKDVWEFARVDPPAVPTGDRCTCGHVCPSDYERQTEEAECVHAPDCELMHEVTAPADEADQTLERQTRKMAKKEASQADTIILHQASDGHYHWFCRNCKSERLGISRETVLSNYLPNVTCANCGFQFGVDKRYLSPTESRDISEDHDESGLLAKADYYEGTIRGDI